MGNPGLAVGGNIATPQVTPAVTAGAYSANDVVGAAMTFTVANNGANQGVIVSATITDLAKQSIACDLFLFAGTFTGVADNGVWDIDDAEIANCIGVISFAATDYYPANDSSVAFKQCTIPFKLAAGTISIKGQLVTRGTPTYASVADVTVRLGVLQD